jgi:hypothetical protein
MVHDLTVQLRRYRAVCAGLAAALVLSGAGTTLLRAHESVVIVSALATLVVWCFAVAFAAYEVFRVVHLADDHLLLSLPGGARAALRLRCAVLLVFLCALGVVEVAGWAAAAASSGARPGVTAVVVAALTRLVSFVSFMALLAAVVLAAKWIRHRATALVAVVLLLTGAVVGVGAAQLALVRLSRPDYVWGLGIDTEFHGVSQYATVLPVTIRPAGPATVAETVLPVTAGVNVAIVVLAMVAWWSLRRMRLNLP